MCPNNKLDWGKTSLYYLIVIIYFQFHFFNEAVVLRKWENNIQSLLEHICEWYTYESHSSEHMESLD